MWVTRQPDKKGKDEMTAIDLELLFGNNERNNWGTVEFSSLTNQGQARVQTGTDNNLPKMCRAPRKVKWHAS